MSTGATATKPELLVRMWPAWLAATFVSTLQTILVNVSEAEVTKFLTTVGVNVERSCRPFRSSTSVQWVNAQRVERTSRRSENRDRGMGRVSERGGWCCSPPGREAPPATGDAIENGFFEKA
jgi:hypothetical protein